MGNSHESRPVAKSLLLLLLLLAAGLQVQLVLPIGIAGIKVSPADMGVAIAGLLLLSSRGGRRAIAGLGGVALWLAAATLVLTLSLVNGYIQLGRVSTWALGSKYLGWYILLGYLATGLWISQQDLSRRFIALFVIACTVTAFVTGTIALVFSGTGLLPTWLVHIPLWGLVENRNAFSFLLLAALAATLADGARTAPIFARGAPVILAVLGQSLVYSGSRAALAASACVVAAGLWMRLLGWGVLARSVAIGLALCAATLSLRAAMPIPEAQAPSLYGSPASSDTERWDSTRMALQTWQQHLVLGAGLGQFIEQQAQQGKTPVIIHNTPLWLLTETGAIGAAVFLALGVAVLRRLDPRGIPDGDARAACLGALLLFVAFAAVTQVHELLYQRVLWIILGLALGHPGLAGRAAKAGRPSFRFMPFGKP